MKRLVLFIAVFVFIFPVISHSKEKKGQSSIGVFMEFKNNEYVITGLVTNGPAAKVGIKTGDIVVGFNDLVFIEKSAEEMKKLVSEIRDYPLKIKLTIYREEKLLDFTIEKEIITEEDFQKALMPIYENYRDNGMIIDAPFDLVWNNIISQLAEIDSKLETVDKGSGYIVSKEIYITNEYNGIHESTSEPVRAPTFSVDKYIDQVAYRKSKKMLGVPAIWYYAVYHYTFDVKETESGVLVKMKFIISGKNNLSGLELCPSKGIIEYSFLDKLKQAVESVKNSSKPVEKLESDTSSKSESIDCLSICSDFNGDDFKTCMLKCSK